MSESPFLSLYLGRIGFVRDPLPDRGTLQALQHAQRLAIPFENLDIPLGRGIALGAAVRAKLLDRRRGGYCFEQNALFLDALRAIGFDARPLLARVWLMSEGVPPRTHTLNLVMLEGEELIADVGFGGSYVPVMLLAEDVPSTTPDGVRHRLVRDAAHGWTLERDGGTGWARQYGFTLDPVEPADLEMANHWTATRPGTRFTTLRIVSRATPEGYLSLVDRMLTVSRNGEAEVEEVTDAATYRRILAERFGLALGEDEVARLGLF